MIKDYAKNSKYFSDGEIKTEIESVEKSKKTVLWAQEFSKKVVTVIFLIYVAITVYSSIMIYLAMKLTGDASMVSLLLTETNSTFKDIVGGYIIKAAIENAFKIGGNYYVGVADAKLKALKDRMGIDPDAPLEPEMENDDQSNYDV